MKKKLINILFRATAHVCVFTFKSVVKRGTKVVITLNDKQYSTVEEFDQFYLDYVDLSKPGRNLSISTVA